VGISCAGHVEQTVALLTALEEDHRQEELGSLSSFRGSRELKNLEFSINYEAKGTSSSHGKGRVHIFFCVERFVWALGGVCGSLGWCLWGFPWLVFVWCWDVWRVFARSS
jgi:hypothetical protein